MSCVGLLFFYLSNNSCEMGVTGLWKSVVDDSLVGRVPLEALAAGRLVTTMYKSTVSSTSSASSASSVTCESSSVSISTTAPPAKPAPTKVVPDAEAFKIAASADPSVELMKQAIASVFPVANKSLGHHPLGKE